MLSQSNTRAVQTDEKWLGEESEDKDSEKRKRAMGKVGSGKGEPEEEEEEVGVLGGIYVGFKIIEWEIGKYIN